MTSTSENALNEKERVESIAWTVRLSDGSPGKLLVIFAVAVTAAVLGTVLVGQLLLGLLGFAIILASTAEYWLGVQFKIDSGGVSRRVGLSLSSIQWEDVKRVIIGKREILLSPLEEGGRLDAFRGVAIRTTEENHDRVIDLIRQHTTSHVRFLEN